MIHHLICLPSSCYPPFAVDAAVRRFLSLVLWLRGTWTP